jgi:hypothetical protein
MKIGHLLDHIGKHLVEQGILTEGEGSVHLTYSLRWLVLLKKTKCLQFQKQLI